jgi:hypothetical protein
MPTNWAGALGIGPAFTRAQVDATRQAGDGRACDLGKFDLDSQKVGPPVVARGGRFFPRSRSARTAPA